MKKFLFVALMGLFLVSCNKITESNIVGTWKITEATVNGMSQTITGEAKYEFNKDNVYNFYVNGVLQYTGSYSVSKDAQTVTLDGDVISVSEKKSKSMTWTFTDGSDTYVYKFEKE